MTTVDFYVNASDKLALAVRLVHKALQQQHQVTLLVADAAQAQALSDQLWQASPTSFLANEIMEDAAQTHAPVIIQTVANRYQQDDVLMNLAPEQPAGFSRFKRLIELVSGSETDKAQARTRFKFYKARGYRVQHIDMLKPST